MNITIPINWGGHNTSYHHDDKIIKMWIMMKVTVELKSVYTTSKSIISKSAELGESSTSTVF